VFICNCIKKGEGRGTTFFFSFFFFPMRIASCYTRKISLRV